MFSFVLYQGQFRRTAELNGHKAAPEGERGMDAPTQAL
jgi:hypothetical protein